MCSSISWGSFFQTLILLSALYYSVTLFIFYRNDLIMWFRNLKSAKPKSVLQTNALFDGTRPMPYNEFNEATAGKAGPNKLMEKKQDEKESILRSQVHDLMEDLKIVFTESAGDKIKKPELLLKIQKKLKEYAQIKGTAFEKEINTQIEIESSEQCEIIFSTQELNMLWKG